MKDSAVDSTRRERFSKNLLSLAALLVVRSLFVGIGFENKSTTITG